MYMRYELIDFMRKIFSFNIDNFVCRLMHYLTLDHLKFPIKPIRLDPILRSNFELSVQAEVAAELFDLSKKWEMT